MQPALILSVLSLLLGASSTLAVPQHGGASSATAPMSHQQAEDIPSIPVQTPPAPAHGNATVPSPHKGANSTVPAEGDKVTEFMRLFSLKHHIFPYHLYSVKQSLESAITRLEVRPYLDRTLSLWHSPAFSVPDAMGIGKGWVAQPILTARQPYRSQGPDVVSGLEWGCLSNPFLEALYGDHCYYTDVSRRQVITSQQWTMTWVSGGEGRSLIIRPTQSPYCIGLNPTPAPQAPIVIYTSCESPYAVWDAQSL